MSIDKDTVKYTSHLARIDLGDKELEKLAGQLHDILGFIDKLSKLDVSKVSPTSHILPINTVLREDSPAASLPLEKTLANAPSRKDPYFCVPKVIE
jgi:aspartyl-tRNA(Asn)/glutamyl-tRNA(Gln) amidotransferase subunit C